MSYYRSLRRHAPLVRTDVDVPGVKVPWLAKMVGVARGSSLSHGASAAHDRVHRTSVVGPVLGVLIPELWLARGYHVSELVAQRSSASASSKRVILVELVEEMMVLHLIVDLLESPLCLVLPHLVSQLVSISALTQLSVNVPLLEVTLVPEVGSSRSCRWHCCLPWIGRVFISMPVKVLVV